VLALANHVLQYDQVLLIKSPTLIFPFFSRKQYVFIDGIPGISENFHARSWNQSLNLLWLYGLVNLIAFCHCLKMCIYFIWWHPRVGLFVFWPCLYLSEIPQKSQLYLLQTLGDASPIIGCYKTNDIMINSFDLEHCTHIIWVLPCSFEADQHAKTEGMCMWFSAQVCPLITDSW
jgi:hypothetical protein